LSPSDVSTPLWRRFGSEHKRSLKETRALYDHVTQLHRSKVWSSEDAVARASAAITDLVAEQVELPAYQPLIEALESCQRELLSLETHIFAPIEADLDRPLTLRSQADLNAKLRAQDHFLANEEDIADALAAAIGNVSRAVIESLPPAGSAPFTVPLIAAVDRPGEIMDRIIGSFLTQQHIERNLFTALNQVLYENLCAASGVPTDVESTKPLIWPSAAKMSPEKLLDTYLAGTPLHALLSSPYPFTLPDAQRFAGHWVIAPPGRGKTTLLHAMVADDLRKDASIILMDSKGDFIEPFRDLKELEDRLILIDPDPQHPISINPLDIPRTDLSQAIDLLEYLFASLLEFKLTPTQTMLFRSVLRLLVTEIPNPTLEIFRDLLANGCKKYERYVDKLAPDLREFFRTDYDDENFRARRREVLQRLRLLLDNDTMHAMLLSVHTRFFIDEALDSGKVVIINNSKSRLGEQGAEFFGRFFIAQILAAAQRRTLRKASQKKPVYFYIDEAHNVISRDERIPTILDECRSQNIALILAHQRTSQITSPNVLSALQNCAVRFANSDEEARSLAHSLRAPADFLQSLDIGQFAAYVRDVTKSAVAVDVPKPDFAKYQRLSLAEQAQLRARMTEQYGPQGAPAESKPVANVAPEEEAKAEHQPPAKPGDPGEPAENW